MIRNHMHNSLTILHHLLEDSILYSIFFHLPHYIILCKKNKEQYKQVLLFVFILDYSSSSSSSSSPKLFSNASENFALIFSSISCINSGLSFNIAFTFSLPWANLSPLYPNLKSILLYSKGIENKLIEDYFSVNSEELYYYELKSAKNIFIKKQSTMDTDEIKNYLRKKGYREDIIKQAIEDEE